MRRKLLLLPALGIVLAGCEILEENLSGDRVHVLSPTDGMEVPEGTVVFRWNGLQDATGYLFTLVSPSFETAERIVADTVIYADTLSRHYGCRAVLSPGVYRWRVAAFNSAYESEAAELALTVCANRDSEP